MSEIAYFDANAQFGRSCARLPGAPYDLKGLISELDHCHISRALVYHAAAREQDSRRANRELLEQISGESRLAPQMVLNPGPWSPDRDLASELDKWLEQGVRAFRIFPRWHVVDLFDSGMRGLLASMAEKKLPLWLDYDQFWYNFSQLGQHEHRAANLAEAALVAGEYPDLPVVACGVSWNTHTQLFPLLDKYPNLLVETSLFQGFEAIALVCKHWGAERLLFGTGQPVFALGAARAGLAYAEIPDSQKQQIASGNLEKLLGLKPTATLPEETGRSSIMLSADMGETLSSKVAIHDSHGHIAPEGEDGISGLTLGPQDGGSIVRRMDRLGFKSMCVSSWEILGGDSMRGNMDAARAAVEYPGRILPYAAVNPNYPEDWKITVSECFERRSFFGFKPYPTSQRRAITHPSFRDMLRYADQHRLPILCHFGFEPLAGVSPGELRALAPLFPGAQFLIAHAGASHKLADEVVGLAVEFENIWLEINYTSVPYGMIAYLIKHAGVENILFGTDTPMRDPAPILGWVVYDHITDSEREAVLGGNFLRLIERTGFKIPK